MRVRSQVLASSFAAFVSIILAISNARADTRTVVVYGKAGTREQTVVAAAVTGALKQAQWQVVDSPFSSKDTTSILACLEAERPWPCIEPYANAKGVSTMVFVETIPEKGGGMRLVGQIAERSDAVPRLEQQFCNPCSDTTLAQSSAALARLLVEKGPAPNTTKKVTAIRIQVTPADVAIIVDEVPMTPVEQLVHTTPGPHNITLQREGFVTVHRAVTVVDGETFVLEETLVADKETPVPGRRFPWVAASLIGGGAVTVLVGSWVSWTAEPGEFEQRHEYYYSTPGLIAAGLGGAAIIGGIYLLIREPRSSSGATASLVPGGAVAGWSTSF